MLFTLIWSFFDLTMLQEDDEELMVASAKPHPYSSIHAASVAAQNPYDTMFGGTTPPTQRQTPPTQSRSSNQMLYSEAGVYSEPSDVTGINRDSEPITI